MGKFFLRKVKFLYEKCQYSLWDALAHSPKGAARSRGEKGSTYVVMLQEDGSYRLEWGTPPPQGGGMETLPPLMSKTELANAIPAQGIPVDLDAQVWEPV